MDSCQPDEKLDLAGVPCPQNSARTLIKLEGMDSGAMLEVIIDDGEPVKNVPPSVEEEGHRVVEKVRTGDRWKILIRRREE
ncbi:MAG: sulfurtransferase TusA family protein [Candidatus Omnitrophica bacterium]|nr:sulfurtransferase TusA family protein [Candidatus Omnitrophota bacterium]